TSAPHPPGPGLPFEAPSQKMTTFSTPCSIPRLGRLSKNFLFTHATQLCTLPSAETQERAMPIEIRVASPDDAPLLVALIKEMAAQQKKKRSAKPTAD